MAKRSKNKPYNGDNIHLQKFSNTLDSLTPMFVFYDWKERMLQPLWAETKDASAVKEEFGQTSLF